VAALHEGACYGCTQQRKALSRAGQRAVVISTTHLQQPPFMLRFKPRRMLAPRSREVRCRAKKQWNRTRHATQHQHSLPRKRQTRRRGARAPCIARSSLQGSSRLLSPGDPGRRPAPVTGLPGSIDTCRCTHLHGVASVPPPRLPRSDVLFVLASRANIPAARGCRAGRARPRAAGADADQWRFSSGQTRAAGLRG
jgi:hypothetical protein